MNIKTIIFMIFQIAMISAYMPNHEYNMLEKRKWMPERFPFEMVIKSIMKIRNAASIYFIFNLLKYNLSRITTN